VGDQGEVVCELTFAIPYYSGRHYLDRAIASVLRQRDPQWRLHVCDGQGIEPDLEAFVHSFADPRIRFFGTAKRLGMAENWNRCLDSTETDLVTLLHADDELLENYCGLMRTAAQRHPAAAAFFCPARVIDREGAACFSFPDYVKRWLGPGDNEPLLLCGETGLRALLRGNFIMCPTLCYRKARLGGRHFSNRWQFVTDLDLTLHLLMDGQALLGLPEVAYAYRRHEESATVQHTDNLLRFREEVRLYSEVADFAVGRGWNRAAYVARTKWMIRLHLGYRILRDLGDLRLGPAWEKLAFLNHGFQVRL
jgi:glycosyltransferase involved in cell wall biosynthesis